MISPQSFRISIGTFSINHNVHKFKPQLNSMTHSKSIFASRLLILFAILTLNPWTTQLKKQNVSSDVNPMDVVTRAGADNNNNDEWMEKMMRIETGWQSRKRWIGSMRMNVKSLPNRKLEYVKSLSRSWKNDVIKRNFLPNGGMSRNLDEKILPKSRSCWKNVGIKRNFLPNGRMGRNLDENLLPKGRSRNRETEYSIKTQVKVWRNISSEFSLGGLYGERKSSINKKMNSRQRSINGNRKSIKIIHANIGPRHWSNKVEDIQLLIDEHRPDIFSVSESNIFKNDLQAATHIQDYNMIHSKSLETWGYSRMTTLIHKDIDFVTLDRNMCDDVASTWIQLKLNGRKKLTLGSVYREHRLLGQGPNSDSNTEQKQTERWAKFLRQVERMRNDDVVVIGDTNLDFLKWQSPPQIHVRMVEDSKMILETEGFSQTVNEATRMAAGAENSLLDHCWLNCPLKWIGTKNLPNGVADHNVVEVNMITSDLKKKQSEFRIRNRKEFNLEEYRSLLRHMDWQDVMEELDPNLANNLLQEKILSVLDHCAPMITVRPSTRKKPWVSNMTKAMMSDRDSLKRTACLSRRQEDWASYAIRRNECTKAVRKDRRDFYNKKYDEIEEKKDTRLLYKTVSRQLGWKAANSPSCFLKDGLYRRKPCELAEIQSEFFKNKIDTLRSRIPVTNRDPLLTLRAALENWEGYDQMEVFEFREVEETEVLNLMKKLNGSYSRGWDEIDGKSLADGAEFLTRPVTHVINLSLATNQCVNKWKIGKLVPVYKSDGKPDPNLPGSYRPIALLPTISKLAEKLAASQLINFLEANKLLNNNIHSYRNNLSTVSAATELTDEIFTALDGNRISNIAAIDQSAAFDLIERETLLKKLELYKIGGNALAWLDSYLSYRSVYVNIEAANSGKFRALRALPSSCSAGVW